MHVAAAQYIKSCSHRAGASVHIHIKLQHGDDLSDFHCGIFVGGRFAGLSVSENADLLEFFHSTVSTVTQNGAKKQKTLSSSPASKTPY